MKQPNNQQRYQELARKRLDGTITPGEARELAEWLNSDDGQPLEVPAAFAESRARHEQRILRGITGQTGRIAPLRRRMLRVAAAAAVLALAAGGYLYFRTATTPEPAETLVNMPNDRPPGRNRSVLTLANGEQVALDSLASGTALTQGGTRLQKLDSGRLAYLPGNEKGAPQFNTLSTPRGGQFRLQLPDGTNVWLNAASAIRYPTFFSGAGRLVELTGEAYFEVAPDVNRPFRVKINATNTIEVLGTSFNVNAYTEENYIRTTLVEGAVRVSSGARNVTLRPGQQAQASAARPFVKVLEHADISKAVAWKNGLFNFQDASLQEVMRQLARWYDIEVVYEQGVPDLEFIGEIERSLPLSEVLKGLRMSGVNFRLEQGKRLVVYP